jgi:glucose-6-phosphate isomerase
VNFRISVSGAAATAARNTVPTLVTDLVASGITALNPALWGPEAEAEAGKRLGWSSPRFSRCATRCGPPEWTE